LNRARLDDGEEPLGVTPRASTNGHASSGGCRRDNGADLLGKRNATTGFGCVCFAASLGRFGRLAALEECFGNTRIAGRRGGRLCCRLGGRFS
jgi:hypothetical protein